jgi:regulatory protein
MVASPRVAPGPLTSESLDKAALRYLERYASSAANLRRVLIRRVERAARAGSCERAEGARLVDEVVERYRARGLLDDRIYADGRVRTLHRQGRSRTRIAAMLAAKGVAREEIDRALAAFEAATPEADLVAALAFARRRRLGPYRAAGQRSQFRQRDLAALARAGFSLEIARRIVDTARADSIEDELACLNSNWRTSP